MKTELGGLRIGKYWPPLLAAILAASVAFALLAFSDDPSPASRRSSEPDLLTVGSTRTGDPPPIQRAQSLSIPLGEKPSDRTPAESPVSENEFPGSPDSSTDTKELTEETELERRIADWRYIGYLRAAGRSVAVIQRMRYPDRPLRVPEGGSIQEVEVEEILADRIVVAYAGDRDEIFLDQDDPFDLSTVRIPSELADEPDALVDLVFAQTLGRYLPEESSADPLEEENAESENEAVQSLAEANGWSEPYYNESTEDFAGRLVENLLGVDSDKNPRTYALTEENRNRMFGFKGGTPSDGN